MILSKNYIDFIILKKVKDFSIITEELDSLEGSTRVEGHRFKSKGDKKRALQKGPFFYAFAMLMDASGDSLVDSCSDSEIFSSVCVEESSTSLDVPLD